MSKAVVYYMQCADTLRIKIGHSTELQRRLAALNSGSPTRIELVATEPGGRELEAMRHMLFLPARVRHLTSREWFYPVPPLLDLIQELGGDPRDGPVTPSEVAGEYARLVTIQSVGAAIDRLTEVRQSLVREYERHEVHVLEGLVNDLLTLYWESWYKRRGWRHPPYGGLSSSFVADVRRLRSWLEPEVERIRSGDRRHPASGTIDPALALPPRHLA